MLGKTIAKENGNGECVEFGKDSKFSDALTNYPEFVGSLS